MPKYLIDAVSDSGQRQKWLEDFGSSERAVLMVRRRGWRVETIAEVEPGREDEAEAAVARANSAAGTGSSDEAAAKARVVLTTSQCVAGSEIERELGIVSAECAYGVNLFRDVFAGVRDVVGGRSAAMQNVMRDARNTVLDELRSEALLVGADAVIGVRLHYESLGTANMLLIAATGSAVKLRSTPADQPQSP